MVKKNIIDIVSFATPCSFEQNHLIKDLLQKNGFEYNFFNEEKVSVKEVSDNFFALDDVISRFVNFQMSVNNPYSKILWCNRGGYGSADILPFIYQMPKPQFKKTLIGFSDIVSVASYLQQKWGWRVICAPVLLQIVLNKVSVESTQNIFNLLNRKNHQLEYNLKLLSGQGGEIKDGVIVGGCLSVLCGNLATKNQINWHNKILFLEDEGEDGERLDRYFTQIAYIINEKKIFPQAILLGNFTMKNEFGNPQFAKIEIAIQRFCQKLKNINIWQETTGSLGHSWQQVPLILGVKTQIFIEELSKAKLITKINKNLI